MLVDVKRHFCPCIWALAAVSGSACAVVLLLGLVVDALPVSLQVKMRLKYYIYTGIMFRRADESKLHIQVANYTPK